MAEGNFWLTVRKNQQRLWWDGYKGEATVILDEFEGQIPQSDMKRYLDSKPLSLEIKGGSLTALYSKIILISNFHPFDWYRRVMEEPLIDRIFGRCDRVGSVFSFLSRVEGPVEIAVDAQDLRVDRRVFPEVRGYRNHF